MLHIAFSKDSYSYSYLSHMFFCNGVLLLPIKLGSLLHFLLNMVTLETKKCGRKDCMTSEAGSEKPCSFFFGLLDHLPSAYFLFRYSLLILHTFF